VLVPRREWEWKQHGLLEVRGRASLCFYLLLPAACACLRGNYETRKCATVGPPTTAHRTNRSGPSCRVRGCVQC